MKIESERLILRSYEDSDVGDLIEGLNNIEVTFIEWSDKSGK